MRAIQATAPGGADVLELVRLPEPSPAADEVLVQVRRAGVNFIDTYRREGRYPMAFPHVVGSEGVGIIVATGAEVDRLQVGDRVTWTSSTSGSYAELVTVRAADALLVPEGIDDGTAVAVTLQGLTAHFLVTSTFPVAAGHDVLVHAAAGGVGLLLTQMATARGARVLATVGSPAKEELARAAGAEEVIPYRELTDLSAQLPVLVRALTHGRGVHAVYDSVGKDTFDASLASLARRGTLVLFGASSGPVPPVDPQRLNAGGSLFLTRPTLYHHIAEPDELAWRAREVFGAVADGSLDVRVGATYPLADAADAHRALESRATTGKVLLEL
ncbi:quinone oxidoreductase family protein [Cellulomonas soli]|uniref:Quinone oxidoreductase n=1 Tax=Cellulomonas soli TaxID=931535 RepID=A0A512PC18_9CELL|nr:quinone oxidoreductase [Cellulomonas soli]NYI60922.1 NADPH2:quinone reductase [Cellulomonas soli]GEP68662.1 quinone oxidoreductase [Cellulomonas soli]